MKLVQEKNSDDRNVRFLERGDSEGSVKRKSLLLGRAQVTSSLETADRLFQQWSESDRSEESVSKIIDSLPELAALRNKYDWFCVLMKKVLLNKVNRVVKVKSDASELTREEAGKIGASLAFSLLCNSSPGAAVDEWVTQYKALSDFEELYPEFLHFMVRLASLLVRKALWGLRLRVCMSSFFGVAEMVTDVLVAKEFFQTGHRNFGLLIVAMVSVCLALQFALVVLQNYRLGFRRISAECLVVLVGLRPALDAYRVSTCKSREEGQPFEPFLELMITRVIEMFAESIPGFVVQLAAIASGTAFSTAAASSLAFSAVSIGIISAMFSYEFDIDPKARYCSPIFYGYVPDTAQSRTVIFLFMVVFSCSVLLVRACSLVLLWLLSIQHLGMYLAVDYGVFLLYKVATGDFFHWLPFPRSMSVFASISARILMKTITDFTATLDFRIPIELGGAYWIFNTFQTFLLLPVCVVLYTREFGGPYLEGWSLWVLTAVSVSTSVLSLGGVIYMAKSEYRSTFWSPTTGSEYVVKLYRTGIEEEDDYIRADAVFSVSGRVWSSIEEEVREWVSSQWWRWKKESPVWFDLAMSASIPLDMIPKEGREEARKKRKTMSIGEKIEIRKMRSTMSFRKTAPRGGNKVVPSE
ncbi:hypothetical protein TrRE_jg6404 [Triparma retinervis]|uniref:Uncharacterized protein n=1 Tax=Triparma retinervis TaxID=2557542 RepID=A0A9W7EBB0_9STRA|nr:hypothetical protein TrRE_jg6404 [Triparma retinervis]